ncbi:hypothetical protein BCR44DRAFT_1453475, partial [Catenaria anguillulae PL171]
MRSVMERKRPPNCLDQVVTADGIKLLPSEVMDATAAHWQGCFGQEEHGNVDQAPASIRRALQPLHWIHESWWDGVEKEVIPEDIAHVLCSIDIDKAPGATGLRHRHYAALGTIGHKILARLFTDMYLADWVPSEWRYGVIYLTPKKAEGYTGDV